MGRPPKRRLLATALQTTDPPATLPSGHAVARVVRAAGNNLFEAQLGGASPGEGDGHGGRVGLVEMPARFRRSIWVRNGGFVVVDTQALNAQRSNKLAGEIVNVVRGVGAWRKMDYWPAEFAQQDGTFGEDEDGDGVADEGEEDDGEEMSVRGGQGAHVGEMPPSESEEEEDAEYWRKHDAKIEQPVYKAAEEVSNRRR